MEWVSKGVGKGEAGAEAPPPMLLCVQAVTTNGCPKCIITKKTREEKK